MELVALLNSPSLPVNDLVGFQFNTYVIKLPPAPAVLLTRPICSVVWPAIRLKSMDNRLSINLYWPEKLPIYFSKDVF